MGILALVAVLISGHAEAYENVNGGALAKCSGPGMALTGFTRSGSCVDQNDDAGSHHICIDLSSTSGGNFCTVVSFRTADSTRSGLSEHLTIASEDRATKLVLFLDGVRRRHLKDLPCGALVRLSVGFQLLYRERWRLR